MADWAHLHFRARQHAATEPGFLAIRHLEMVNLHGGHLGFCVALGVNLGTPAGRATADFHAALIMFCSDLCAQGVGHLPYNPAPLNQGPMGPIGAGPAGGGPDVPGNQGGVPPPPDDDHDFVEVIGGVHPIHGPWAVDNDFVEVIGGVHPVHGPWVEGGPLVDGAGLLPEDIAIIDQMWEEAFGAGNQNQGNIEDENQENAPVQ
jgi:hypothetical protein